MCVYFFFFFQAEDGIRDLTVTGVQTCALPIFGVGGLKTVQDPYTGAPLAAVPALFPDVALLHVHRADVFGNCQIDGYPHMDADIARAATTVLVTTEEIVVVEETRRHPERTVIPGFVVDAL